MTDRITFGYTKDHVREKSQLAVTARFFAANTATTPTNVKYRIDCLTTGAQVADWTSTTAGTEVVITITSAQNALQDQCNTSERRQLSVAADYGLSTQYIETFEYDVQNVHGVS